jgi:hypothetical protein
MNQIMAYSRRLFRESPRFPSCPLALTIDITLTANIVNTMARREDKPIT